MKKVYLQPRLKLTNACIEHPMLVVSDINLYNKPGEDTIGDDDYDNMLAKPTALYDVWEDDDKETDFHTDN